MNKQYKIFILSSIVFLQSSLEAFSMDSDKETPKNKRTLGGNRSQSRDSDEELSDKKAPITRKPINFDLPYPILGHPLLGQQHAIPEKQPNNSVPPSPSYPRLILSSLPESSPSLSKADPSQPYGISHLMHGPSITYSGADLFPPESRI